MNVEEPHFTPRALVAEAFAGAPPVDHARLLGTSVVIALKGLPLDVLPEEPAISALTVAELTAGPHATTDPDERAP